jgi:hypothetical protein
MQYPEIDATNVALAQTVQLTHQASDAGQPGMILQRVTTRDSGWNTERDQRRLPAGNGGTHRVISAVAMALFTGT